MITLWYFAVFSLVVYCTSCSMGFFQLAVPNVHIWHFPSRILVSRILVVIVQIENVCMHYGKIILYTCGSVCMWLPKKAIEWNPMWWPTNGKTISDDEFHVWLEFSTKFTWIKLYLPLTYYHTLYLSTTLISFSSQTFYTTTSSSLRIVGYC